MRTTRGEAGKGYSGHYERRSSGSLKGVRVDQRGRTYPLRRVPGSVF